MSVLLHVSPAQLQVAVSGVVHSGCVLTGEQRALNHAAHRPQPPPASCCEACNPYLSVQESSSQERPQDQGVNR